MKEQKKKKVVLEVLFYQLKTECLNLLQRGEEYNSLVTQHVMVIRV